MTVMMTLKHVWPLPQSLKLKLRLLMLFQENIEEVASVSVVDDTFLPRIEKELEIVAFIGPQKKPEFKDE